LALGDAEQSHAAPLFFFARLAIRTRVRAGV
jgi:hypothetical protein